MSELREKCAVMGVWNHPEAAFLVYLGLYALQHRGQEGAGIVSLDLKEKRQFAFKGRGLVGDVFSPETLSRLKGSAAQGHTRYSTAGPDDLKNIQPLQKTLSFGFLAVSHNGNLTNHKLLKSRFRKKFSFESESDTECFFPLIQEAFREEGGNMEKALQKAFCQAEGAFSLTLLTENSLIAARDPRGFRPLVMGTAAGPSGEAIVIASETCALDLIGAKYIREIEPGEILIADKSGMRSLHLPEKAQKALCVFEHVYFSRPDSFVFEKSVYESRKEMGRILAREAPPPEGADMVVPVPDSGTPAAVGYAEESGLPFEMGIIKNHYIGRTFIHPSPSVRNFHVKIKLNPQNRLVKGKRIVAVDDSIVRGTTSKTLVRVLREAGAKEIHLRISSPPVTAPCFYGVDTPQKKQLIAGRRPLHSLRKYLDADSLSYLSLKGLIQAAGGQTACGRQQMDSRRAGQAQETEATGQEEAAAANRIAADRIAADRSAKDRISADGAAEARPSVATGPADRRTAPQQKTTLPSFCSACFDGKYPVPPK